MGNRDTSLETVKVIYAQGEKAQPEMVTREDQKREIIIERQ